MSLRRIIEEKTGLRTIIGWPDYLIDTDTQTVYSLKGNTMRTLQLTVRPSGQRMINLSKSGLRLTVNINRLCYAVLRGIPVKEIPADLVVRRDEDGSYRLLDNRDNLSEANNKKHQLRHENRMRQLERQRMEIDILYGYYQDSDGSVLLSYAESLRSELVAWCCKRYRLSLANGNELFDQAVEFFMQRASRQYSAMTNITFNVRYAVKHVYASRKAETEAAKDMMKTMQQGD